jgi:hypothetical protein
MTVRLPAFRSCASERARDPGLPAVGQVGHVWLGSRFISSWAVTSSGSLLRSARHRMSACAARKCTPAQRRRGISRASVANPGPVRRFVTNPADLATQYRVLMPKHQHLGCYRLVTATQHGDQAENPAGQYIDELEKHRSSQPSPSSTCRQPCRSTTKSSIRAPHVRRSICPAGAGFRHPQADPGRVVVAAETGAATSRRTLDQTHPAMQRGRGHEQLVRYGIPGGTYWRDSHSCRMGWMR